MRLLYRSHGKHCYLRSFPTKCKQCGASVLYWECTHGSKLFFNYPIYGKLIRHNCPKSTNKNIKRKFSILVKTPEELFSKDSIFCPVCGKIFKNKNNFDSHLNNLKKSDIIHRDFYKNKLIFGNSPSEIKSEIKFKKKSNYSPKFGQISIKKRVD